MEAFLQEATEQLLQAAAVASFGQH